MTYIYTDTNPITLPCSLARAGKNTTRFPAIMEELIPAEIIGSSVESKSISNIQKDWFVAVEVNKSEVLKAKTCDLVFFLIRNNCDKGIGWTNFRSTAQ